MEENEGKMEEKKIEKEVKGGKGRSDEGREKIGQARKGMRGNGEKEDRERKVKEGQGRSDEEREE